MNELMTKQLTKGRPQMTRKELIKLAAAEIVRSETNEQAQAPDWTAAPPLDDAWQTLLGYIYKTLGDDWLYDGEFSPFEERTVSNLGEGIRSDSLANELFNNYYNILTGWLPDDAYSHMTGDSLSNFADSLMWGATAGNEGEDVTRPSDWYSMPSDQREAFLNVIGDYTMPDELIDLEY